jgi:transglutaminase-like putative cysteine protease
VITPTPDVVEQHDDYFGNHVYSFVIESLHKTLDVEVQSDVTVYCEEAVTTEPSPRWQDVAERVQQCVDAGWFEVQEFCFDSPRIARHESFADYARQSFSEGRAIVEAATELTQRIHDDFRYDTTATTVSTSTQEAFRLKAGVCQDFAHVQIACLRSLGLPAKYVSGYLRTIPAEGKPRLVGADESHAWISLYCGETIGWLDLDPTNACRAKLNHIPICVGRDYSEVSPMRGVVLGGGKTQLTVNVDVKLIQ